ncbi:MAG: hypothetical protein ACRDLV_12250, partial [Solirubrobacteraceae bacterium]
MGPALNADRRRQQVVDDLDGRVDDVEQVAERPDRRLHQRQASAGRRAYEPVQAARAADMSGPAHPDGEQGGERDQRGDRRKARRRARAAQRTG